LPSVYKCFNISLSLSLIFFSYFFTHYKLSPPSALCTLGKHSTTELHAQPFPSSYNHDFTCLLLLERPALECTGGCKYAMNLHHWIYIKFLAFDFPAVQPLSRFLAFLSISALKNSSSLNSQNF
jgi:hypothetical protein